MKHHSIYPPSHDARMYRVSPVNQITPFTYRDGSTYLEVLNALREYVTHVAVPEVHRELNRIIGEFQTALAQVERTRDEDLTEWVEKFDQFMVDVTDSLAGLNDSAVAQNILDSDSDTWNALHELFPSHSLVNALIDNVRADIASVETALDNAVDNLNTAISDAVSSLEAEDSRLDSLITNTQNNLESAVNTLEDEDSRLDSLITSTQNNLSNAVSSLEAEDSRLDSLITSTRNSLESDLSSAVSSLEDEDSRLDSLISTTQSNLSNAVSSLEGEDSRLDSRITSTRSDLETALNVRTANMVNGTGVGRVIASTNAETELNNGDLLIALETEQYFTDFTENPVSEEDEDGNFPDPIRGWTPHWAATDADYSIMEDSGATGGKALLFNHWTDDRKAISWDVASNAALNHSIVEVVFKWRPGRNSMVSLRGITHGSGSPPYESGFFGGKSYTNRNLVGSWNADRDPYSYMGEDVDPTPQYPEWWVTRFRTAEDYGIYVKNWKHGYPEPESWHRANINTNRPRGWVGLANIVASDGAGIVDWFGVAFDGGRAPMGG